eukprot:7146611-Prymnesium_polylepis.2
MGDVAGARDERLHLATRRAVRVKRAEGEAELLRERRHEQLGRLRRRAKVQRAARAMARERSVRVGRLEALVAAAALGCEPDVDLLGGRLRKQPGHRQVVQQLAHHGPCSFRTAVDCQRAPLPAVPHERRWREREAQLREDLASVACKHAERRAGPLLRQRQPSLAEAVIAVHRRHFGGVTRLAKGHNVADGRWCRPGAVSGSLGGLKCRCGRHVRQGERE